MQIPSNWDDLTDAQRRALIWAAICKLGEKLNEPIRRKRWEPKREVAPIDRSAEPWE